MRNLFFSLFATSVLYSVHAHALPIENADAFVVGDGKAVYEKSSGLTWLDFGITNRIPFYELINDPNSTSYSGWRLPTEAEVLHLYKALLPEFSVPDDLPPIPKFTLPDTIPESIAEYIQSEDFSPRWNDIYSIWGVNDAKPDLGEGNGHRLFSYSSVGWFMEDSGSYYGIGLYEFTFGAGTENSNEYYGQISMFDIRGNPGEAPNVSTLLVRDTPIAVPEPGLITLFLFGFGAILSQRFNPKKQSGMIDIST